MSKIDLPQEEGVRRRYLVEYERLRTVHQLTRDEYGQRIGYKSGDIISQLISGKKKINLTIIISTLEAFPDFQIYYVLVSKEVPELNITNLQGKHGKGKAGRKTHKEKPKRKPPEKPSGLASQKLAPLLDNADYLYSGHISG